MSRTEKDRDRKKELMQLAAQLQAMKDTLEIKAVRRFLELSYEEMLEDLVADTQPVWHTRLQGKAEMVRQLNGMFDKPLMPQMKQEG